MKTTVVIVLLILSLTLNGLLWWRVSTLEAVAAPPSDFPLGEVMGYLQRYTDKIWYAVDAGNWDLARYYHDELTETAGTIVAAGVEKEGVDVSQNMETLLPPTLQGLDEAIAAGDPVLFRERYTTMVNECNACHVAAKHPFIRVALPGGPPQYWNQNFGPQ